MIIVTAGHVDHGKSALLHAITGTHTAHLPEEKKRGLTIDLGYAYLPIHTDSNQTDTLGFIDVPGHQKFLSNMLAGLGGVEHALLVVSAEEGIKPQTLEHFEILNLLNFKHIMVVLTKADKVEPAQIDLLISQIKQQLPSLNSAPFFVTSCITGAGIAELKAYLIAQNRQVTNNQPFRYVIDRVFHIKGAGQVVTGTAVAGKVVVGDEIYLSDGTKVRVKAIHAQNHPSESGVAGQRLALNLANVDKQKIARGHCLTELAPTFATDRITVKLSAAQPLKETSVVHIYHFASHITGKLSLLNAKQAVKNTEYFAEVLLDEPLHIAFNDKLIIRNGDDSQTVAGAQVLEIHSPKRHKRSEARLAYLTALAQAGNHAQRIALYLQHNVLALERLLWDEQLFATEIARLGFDTNAEWLYSSTFKQTAQQKVLTKLAEYHSLHQDQLGVAKARLRRMALLELPEKLGLAFIDDLLTTQLLAQTRGWLHLPDHRIEFNPQELQIWQQIRPLFEATNQALWVRDIANQLAIDETEMRNLLYKAGKLGYLIPIVKDRFLLNEQIEAFAQLIRDFILQHGEISVNQLRDELQYGRKLTVQLIEYFDRSGFLRRKGNVHLLRDHDIF
ncbi:selenocysteine-specific translation elongation factor [Actinobacillus suis]|uniref:Selenocysteine-specific elongation factor n=2 Tax=Actinobacillus suis TaxID=716 RepID=K0FZ62_ACTSU|nr:selenocysteine-specific translation elongation factor [Actinobacillus suis]AFU19857.1 selenocysteine-specific elongation factor [Actinobacillus suis H91-0380]AIJ31995.1 selenocysteine-specific elongation factor [Actinobacillus suis ATCC 33415]MCO4169790.1 selenocysteine-specific translation elongation factor [Actinobacillus suis]MCQ9630523.1 selenocysteine-specific translation elongation factor [Actinobacillus suis]MCQ9632776.1 selenocysteine-specific translation elongation factor [Actinoba